MLLERMLGEFLMVAGGSGMFRFSPGLGRVALAEKSGIGVARGMTLEQQLVQIQRIEMWKAKAGITGELRGIGSAFGSSKPFMAASDIDFSIFTSDVEFTRLVEILSPTVRGERNIAQFESAIARGYIPANYVKRLTESPSYTELVKSLEQVVGHRVSLSVTRASTFESDSILLSQ